MSNSISDTGGLGKTTGDERPWMKLHTGTYLRECSGLTAEEERAYYRLLVHYWSNESLPSDESDILIVSGLPQKAWNSSGRRRLLALFSGNWTHAYLDEQIAWHKGRSDHGKKGAAARWAGKKTVNSNVVPFSGGSK